MAIALHYAARSDVGLIRANNQDSGYAGPHLLVVADGMGGHAGGDIASSLAVAELAGLDGESLGAQEAQGRLNAALRAANARLLDRVLGEPVLAGMGTTVTAVLRAGNRLILAHIGDSRAYLLRDGRLHQVTSDHTYVQRLVSEGSLTPEEAEHHPQRSVLLRVLTGEHGDEPDLSVREGRPGDRLLLCSDGLSGVVSFETIEDTLAQGGDPAATAQRLVQLALRGGGPDNVTVIVADVVDLDRPPSTTPQIVGAAAAADDPRRGPLASGAAARAAMLTRADADLDRHDRRRAPRRGPGLAWWALVTVILLGLAGGVVAAWQWSQEQYYVGAHREPGAGTTDEVVAVYRGLPQDVLGFELSSVVEETDILVTDLPVFAQGQIRSTIVVDDRGQADEVVARLRDDVEPADAEPSPSPAAGPTASPSPAATPSRTPATTPTRPA
ncbi:MAG: PP2C family protein-serine/threonine phosphatase [Kineosporiaceae bacterium]